LIVHALRRSGGREMRVEKVRRKEEKGRERER